MADDIDTSNSLYPLPSPPPLASGPSLLDDSDTRFLDSFFDGVSSDQFLNDPTESWSYDWEDLPPDFLGTTSSFGQHNEPVTNDIQQLTFPEYKNPLGFVPDPEPQPHLNDTLGATSYLHNGQHHGMYTSAPPQAPSMGPPFAQNLMASDFSQLQRRMPKPGNVLRHASMSEALYGAPYANFSPSQTISKKVEIKWGTDTGFTSGRGFVPPPNVMTEGEIDECIASTMECLQPGSNASTRPSSPVVPKVQPFERKLNSITEKVNDEAEDNAKMKKRKKAKAKAKDDDYDDDEESGTAAKNSRKRRPKSMGGASGDFETPQKRRKSSASTAPKMARENLTEDQKRENHIKSEQKRRTLIKEGFEDLNELVPDLRGGGFSKSAVLIMAADWLEELVNGNKKLKAKLAELEPRNVI